VRSPSDPTINDWHRSRLCSDVSGYRDPNLGVHQRSASEGSPGESRDPWQRDGYCLPSTTTHHGHITFRGAGFGDPSSRATLRSDSRGLARQHSGQGDHSAGHDLRVGVAVFDLAPDRAAPSCPIYRDGLQSRQEQRRSAAAAGTTQALRRAPSGIIRPDAGPWRSGSATDS
jgi:hypothetical protein